MFIREEFFARKKIDVNILNKLKLKLLKSISKHSSFIFKHILSKPYIEQAADDPDIARPHHGIMHANRVAIFTGIFANLYRKYGDKEALLLTDEDINLLQITALLHDACREGDHEDRWDQDSATLVFLYLTALNVPREKAILLAEALANKDATGVYAKLTVTEDGLMSWTTSKVDDIQKNIFQKILHDSDSLDILRGRPHFDETYLYFYKKIAKRNAEAFEVMAEFICNARHLIEVHGDSYKAQNKKRKLYFENKLGFLRMISELEEYHEKKYRVLYHLFTEQHLPPHSLDNNHLLDLDKLNDITLYNTNKYDPALGLTEENLNNALNEGKVFARGLSLPTGISQKLRTFNDGSTQEVTLAQIEILKTLRREDIETTSSKDNRDKKHGNPIRSVTMIGNGVPPFSCVGFLMLNPDINKISNINKTDCDTGFKKKEHYKENQRILSNEKKEKQMAKLLRLSKMGGSSRVYNKFASRHNELNYDIDTDDAIYYSLDLTLREYLDRGIASVVHPLSPKLQAYYVQNLYNINYGITLPIVEYSATHDTAKLIPQSEFSDESIIKMWADMCLAYKNSQMDDFENTIQTFRDSINDIKIKAMYGTTNPRQTKTLIKNIIPGDCNYPLHLQNEINQAINRFNFTTSDEYTRVALAVGINDLEKCQQLLSTQDFNTWDEYDLSRLMLAAGMNHDEHMIHLLFSQASLCNKLINQKKFDLLSAVHLAAYYNNVSLLQHSLAIGMNANVQDKFGTTPFDMAIMKGSTACTKLLLDAKVNPNQLSNNGLYILEYAAFSNKHEIVELLIKYGVNVNIENSKELSSPLLQAIIGSSVKSIEVLLNNGVDVELPIITSISRIKKVISNSSLVDQFDQEIQKFSLTETDCYSDSPLHIAALLGSTKAVKFLLTKVSMSYIVTHLDKYIGIESMEANLLLFAPSTCRQLIMNAISDYLRNDKDDNVILSIVNNEKLFNYIIKNNLILASVIANRYWQATQQIIILNKKLSVTLNDIITRENLDAIGSMQNKVVGFDKDKLGRIKCQYPSIRNNLTGNCNAKFRISFNGFNLSQFNMSQLHFKKFRLHNTIWKFTKDDKVEFIKCEMDGFTVTPDSDLTNVTLTEPIFKDQQSTEKVADLFQTIPLFILNKKNIIALENLIAKGKRIFINQYDVFSHLYDMIQANELDLFILALKGAEHDSNYEDCVKELMIAIMKANKVDFITGILDNHLVTLNDNTKKTSDLIVNVFHYEKFNFIPIFLLNSLNPDLILDNKDIFKVLYFLINQDNLTELNEAIDNDELLISIHMDETKKNIYQLARSLLYVCSDIYYHRYNYKTNDIICLITQFKQILTESMAIDDLKLQINNLQIKLNEIINSQLSENALILQLTKQTNQPMSERFALWTYQNSLKISNSELTENDFEEICLYLKNHPEVNKLNVSVINISLQSLSLLTKIKSLNELFCYDCGFNDAHAKILATAPFLTKLRIVSNNEMTLQGAKMIVSNLSINQLYLQCPKDFDKSTWIKVTNESDTQVRLQYGRDTGVIPSLANAPTFFNNNNPVPTVTNNNNQDHVRNNLQLF